MVPCPLWPLAGQSGLGQNVAARSMPLLLAVIWHLPRVGRDLRFCYEFASPRFTAELPFCTLMLENRELFCLTRRKVEFVPAHPFFNLLCPCRGGQVVPQGQHADLLDRSATLRLPTAKPVEIKRITPGFRAIP